MPDEVLLKCPNCNASNWRRIVVKGPVAILWNMVGRVPYHCSACFKVFYAPLPERKETE